MAAILLAYTRPSTLHPLRPKTCPISRISLGVLRLVLPFPPHTVTPRLSLSMASLRAPQVTVVVPLLCQS